MAPNTTPTEFDQQPEVQAPVEKVPVFIGCAIPGMVEQLNAAVSKVNDALEGTQYEVAVLSPQMLESATATFLFQQLGKEQQQSILRNQNDINSRKQAQDTATGLLRVMQAYTFGTDVENPTTDFTWKPYELKAGVKNIRGQIISNKQLREVIDFLTVHNFVQPTIVGAPYHEQMYEFTLDTAAKLANTDFLIAQTRNQLQEAQARLDALESNRAIIQDELTAGMEEKLNADLITTEEEREIDMMRAQNDVETKTEENGTVQSEIGAETEGEQPEPDNQ